MILAELAQEAGVPAGVLQVVHGAHDTVNALLDASEVKALSFVGCDKAGVYVHRRGTELGKRVQSNMQAKNHWRVIKMCVWTVNWQEAHPGQVLLPDANKNDALNGIVGAFAGAAGQRCMALSVCGYSLRLLIQ
jgi:malonate-semialdehyde dehydrogenase (acetylating)/methylmalonate-semialdehyde dehydrogenase